MKARFLGLVVLLTACVSGSITVSDNSFNIAGAWSSNLTYTMQTGNGNGTPVLHFVQNGSAITGMMDDDSPDHRPSQPFSGSLNGDQLTIAGTPPGCTQGHYTLQAKVISESSMNITGGTGVTCLAGGQTASFTFASGTLTKM